MKLNVKLNLGNRSELIKITHNLDIDKRKRDICKALNWNEDIRNEKRTKELYLYWIDYEMEEVPDPQTCIIAHTALEAIQILASELWSSHSENRLIINNIQKFSLDKPKTIFYGNIMPSIHIPELAEFNKQINELKNNLKEVKELKEKKIGRRVWLIETKEQVFLISADSEKEARKFVRGNGKVINLQNKPLFKGIILSYDYEDIYFD